MTLRTLPLLLLLTALSGSCTTTPGILQSPGRYDEQGVHVVTTHDPKTCRPCGLYRKASRYVVRLVTASGVGAGVVLTADGKLATNAHVVGSARSVDVESFDGHSYVGTVVATNTQDDLAVVAMRAEDRTWSTPSMRRGPPPKIGSYVYVIGHPLGLGWTVTRGTISSIHLDGMKTIIKTDAAISVGNSGGAMLDPDGNLIGIVTSKLGGEGAANVAFARPTEALLAFLKNIGTPQR
jgi:serine protease DegQ